MTGDAGHVHPSTGQLDKEQDVHALQEDRVHGEEVAGQDAGSLLA
jgi:hypothetical protein